VSCAQNSGNRSARADAYTGQASHKRGLDSGRREYYDQTHLAVAGLVSDRAARR